MTDAWTLDASDGELTIRTGVAGRAARLGHRLTITVTTWHVTVAWSDGEPAEVTFTADVDSLNVVGGEGGLKSLSLPERMLARSNALGSLEVKKAPQILFHANDIESTEDGYRLAGTLEIHAVERPFAIDLRVADLDAAWRLSFAAVVRQSDFGVKPYSLMMGALRVADDVTVSFSADRAKDD